MAQRLQFCHGPMNRNGKTSAGTQRYRCKCGKSTTDNPPPVLDTMTTSLRQINQVIQLTVEAVSMRSTVRITDLNYLTVQKIIRLAGRHAAIATYLAIEANRGVWCKSLQIDEMWTYVHTKQRHLLPTDPEEYGDQYIFIAIDPYTKFVPCVFVGKRDIRSATIFFKVLRETLRGTTQITTDAWPGYPDVIEDTFGNSSRYTQIGGDNNISWNNPDPALIGTELIERFNGTCRNGLRRLTRRCYGFSKRLNMLQSAVDLFVAHYNFCRVHSSLEKATPAMAAGLADHVWTIEKLLIAGKTQ